MSSKRKGSIGKHLPDWDEKAMEINRADVAELVDARDLKSLDGNIVWVRVPPPAPAFARVRARLPRRSLLAKAGFCLRATAGKPHALTGYAWRSRARPLGRSVPGVG